MESLLEKIKKELNKLGTGLRWTIINRFQRIVKVESKSLRKNAEGNFVPILKKGQLINVEFITQGSVLDENHPAVVWAADKKSEHIIVIPLTSKDGNGRYDKRNVGVINGYNQLESIIKINQPHSVSRKSVTLIKQVDQKTNVYLSQSQLLKMEDFFREYHLKEPSFKTVIEKHIGIAVPISIPHSDLDQAQRPVIYEVKGEILWYRFCNENSMRKIDTVKLNISTLERKKILERIFNENTTFREATFREISEKIPSKVS